MRGFRSVVTRGFSALAMTVAVAAGLVMPIAAPAGAAPGNFIPTGDQNVQVTDFTVPSETYVGGSVDASVSLGNNEAADVTVSLDLVLPDGVSLQTPPSGAVCTGGPGGPATITCTDLLLPASSETTVVFGLGGTATPGGQLQVTVHSPTDTNPGDDTAYAWLNVYGTVDLSGNLGVSNETAVVGSTISAWYNTNSGGQTFDPTLSIDAGPLSITNLNTNWGWNCVGTTCTGPAFDGNAPYANFSIVVPPATPAGVYPVTVTVTAANDPGSPRVSTRNITVVDSVAATGRVVDTTSGNPVADICVGVRTNSGYSGDATTAGDGTYTLDVPVGDQAMFSYDDCRPSPVYARSYYHDTFEQSNISVITVSGPITLLDQHLVVGQTMTGHVTSTGNPAGQENIGVSVSTATSGNVGWAYTDSNGDYTVDRLPPGTYTVEFRDGFGVYAMQWYDHSSTRTAATPVTVGVTPVTGIDAALTAAATISGTVTEAGTGDPLANICVEAYEPGHVDPVRGSVRGSSADSNGNYTINGLPASTYVVVASDCNQNGDHVPTWYGNSPLLAGAVPVTTTVGGTTAGIDIAMPTSTRTVSGTIRHTITNTPYANSCAVAYAPEVGVVQIAFTPADGTYTLHGLAPGVGYYIGAGSCQGIPSGDGAPFAWYNGHLGAGFNPFDGSPLAPQDTDAILITAANATGIDIYLGPIPNPTVTVTSMVQDGGVMHITLARTGPELWLESSVDYTIGAPGVASSGVHAQALPTVTGTAFFANGQATVVVDYPVPTGLTAATAFQIVLSNPVHAVIDKMSMRVTGTLAADASNGGGGTNGSGGTAPSGTLPFTGAAPQPEVFLGVGLIGLGAIGVAGRRFRLRRRAA